MIFPCLMTPGDATCYNSWNPQGRSGSFMPGKESTALAPQCPSFIS